jgi:hypothetical protein
VSTLRASQEIAISLFDEVEAAYSEGFKSLALFFEALAWDPSIRFPVE